MTTFSIVVVIFLVSLFLTVGLAVFGLYVVLRDDHEIHSHRDGGGER